MAADLIFDAGMHNGDDTAFYLARNFRVVAVEANPLLAAAAEKRFEREIVSGRLVVLNIGIAEQDGEAQFWICEDKSEWSSFDRSIASRDNCRHHAIAVKTRRFSSVLSEFGVPHYVKLDIEGNDRYCVQDLASVGKALPTYLSWENDVDSPIDWTHDRSTLRIAHELGYSRFKLIDQSTFGTLTKGISVANFVDSAAWYAIRRRIPGARALGPRLTHRGRLERRFQRRFPMGCSGPWGEDLPGAWLSFAHARATLDHFIGRHQSDPSRPTHSLWCDWHAAL